jgi:thiol-disulfide isomerase/thioredoxin
MSNKSFLILLLAIIIISADSLNSLCKAQNTTDGNSGKRTKSKVFIYFKLRKHESCTFQYNDTFFDIRYLNFNNERDKDSVVIKSIYTDQSISWSYAVYNGAQKGNWQIMQYIFRASPGDTLHLSYSERPFLNTSLCNKKNIVADSDSSYYTDENYKPSNSTLITKDESWALFNNYFNKKYYKEVNRIYNLLSTSQIDSLLYNQLNMICRMHYYKKMIDWVFQNNGGYYKPAVSILNEKISEIDHVLNDKNIFLMRDLLDVMDGMVRIKLINKGKDYTNDINVYQQAATLNIGKYKPDYLNICIIKNSVKTGVEFRATVTDYNNRYKNTSYVSHTDSLLNVLIKVKYISTNNKLITLDGKPISVGGFINTHKKFTLIDFWASWCSPCRDQLPYMDSIKRIMKKYPIEFISINLDEKMNNWKIASKAEKKYLSKSNFYLLKEQKAAFVNNLNILSIPRYIVLKGSKIIASDFYQPKEPSFVKNLIDLIETTTD